MDPVIQPEELRSLRGQIVLLDARSGKDAATRHEDAHLEGALHVDLDRDLAAHPEDPARGGRHPLPPIERFAALLGSLGIEPASRVVAYDDKAGANAAARLWWMLRAIGHRKAQVLDGGIEAGIAAGIPIERGVRRPEARPPYPAIGWALPTASADEVAAAARDRSRLVIDVREATRYRGESEPIDPIAGHVPGAINVPFVENLDARGRFLAPDALAAKYRAVLGDRSPSTVIVHCGSGVTACHTLLALERAGLAGAALYVGSWSEWSRSARPIAEGSEPEGSKAGRRDRGAPE